MDGQSFSAETQADDKEHASARLQHLNLRSLYLGTCRYGRPVRRVHGIANVYLQALCTFGGRHVQTDWPYLVGEPWFEREHASELKRAVNFLHLVRAIAKDILVGAAMLTTPIKKPIQRIHGTYGVRILEFEG